LSSICHRQAFAYIEATGQPESESLLSQRGLYFNRQRTTPVLSCPQSVTCVVTAHFVVHLLCIVVLDSWYESSSAQKDER
jgi:hypothetical protein